VTRDDTSAWKELENWAPHLFITAGILSLVAAANYGVAELFDNISFSSWVGLSVLLARVASLLGVAGLSVRIMNRSTGVGKLSRVIVVLALLSTGGLLTTAVLGNLGIETPVETALGLGTVALSLVTYSLFGAAVLRTGGHDRLIGALLLGATVALLFGLFGRAALPVGVVGTIAELGLFATHLIIGYRLRTETLPEERAEPTRETVVE
jgi:hypothetical protein